MDGIGVVFIFMLWSIDPNSFWYYSHSRWNGSVRGEKEASDEAKMCPDLFKFRLDIASLI